MDRPVAWSLVLKGRDLDEARAEADYFVRIPMFGFTESYNISVAAALTLQSVTQRVRAASDLPWRVPHRTTPVSWRLGVPNRKGRRWPVQRLEKWHGPSSPPGSRLRSPAIHESSRIDQLQRDTQVGAPRFCGHVHPILGGSHRQFILEPSLRCRAQWRRQCRHPLHHLGHGRSRLSSCGQILIARRMGEGRSERALVLLRTGLVGMLGIGLCWSPQFKPACTLVFLKSSGMRQRDRSSPISWPSGNGASCRVLPCS